MAEREGYEPSLANACSLRGTQSSPQFSPPNYAGKLQFPRTPSGFESHPLTEAEKQRVVVDAGRTLRHQEIQLLVKTTIRKGRRGFIYFGTTRTKSATFAANKIKIALIKIIHIHNRTKGSRSSRFK